MVEPIHDPRDPVMMRTSARRLGLWDEKLRENNIAYFVMPSHSSCDDGEVMLMLWPGDIDRLHSIRDEVNAVRFLN